MRSVNLLPRVVVLGVAVALELAGVLSGRPAAAASVAWQVVPSPNPTPGRTDLNGVACTTVSNCWAVGYATSLNDRPVILHWSGSAWSRFSSPSFSVSAVLNRVACASASSCWAVGTTEYQRAPKHALVEHWDGGAWSASFLPDPAGGIQPAIADVACVTASDCWVVGSYLSNAQPQTEPLAEHWNGSSWTSVSTASPSAGDVLWGVACTSTSYCLAVGATSSGLAAERWNGSAWAFVAPPKPIPGGSPVFKAVTCASATECWAVGAANSYPSGVVIEEWNGAAWTLFEPSSTNGAGELDAVTCVSAGDCWSVGGGPALAVHWNGST